MLWEALPKSHILNTRNIYVPTQRCPHLASHVHCILSLLWREWLWGADNNAREEGWEQGANQNLGEKVNRERTAQ